MAMKQSNRLYKVVNENNLFIVIEKKTNHRIKEFFSKNKATEYAQRLGLGAGFHGFTPQFMTRKVL